MKTITDVLGTNKELTTKNIQTIKTAYIGNNTNNNKGINVIIKEAGSIIEENNKQKQHLIDQFNGLKGSYTEVLVNENITSKLINKNLIESKNSLNKNKTTLNTQIKTKVESMVKSLQKK